jgi:hypothetical protein
MSSLSDGCAHGGGRFGGWRICDCDCHRNITIEGVEVPMGNHVMACCAKCGVCNELINGDMDQHMKDRHPHWVPEQLPKTGQST